MLEGLAPILTLLLMIACLGLIVVPAMPVTVIEWSIAVVFGVWSAFERLTLPAAGLITVLALLGATSGLWMPIFGMRGKQTSCLGTLGLFVGMILGSMAMPVVGTLIGGMLGVMIVEYGMGKEFDDAMDTGQSAMKTILMTMAAEFIFAFLIVVTFGISILLTA